MCAVVGDANQCGTVESSVARKEADVGQVAHAISGNAQACGIGPPGWLGPAIVIRGEVALALRKIGRQILADLLPLTTWIDKPSNVCRAVAERPLSAKVNRVD